MIRLVAVVLLLSALPAKAQHPAEHQALHEKFYRDWYMPDSPKQSCCNNMDCAPAASRVVDGNWQAEFEGQWVDIPPQKIEQNRDSPDGRSHLCAKRNWSGFAVFCFIRGSGT